jgi:hypothetical protein
MPDDDRNTGEPIRALRELEQDTSPFFLKAIRGKIHRRTTASQFLSVSWQLPKIVFVELARMLMRILSAGSIRKGD